MSKSIPCQGRKHNGGVCNNPASTNEPFCHQHRYQSARGNSDTSRLGSPVLATTQQSFSLFDYLDEPEALPAPVITSSPKGYDGVADTMPRQAIFRGRKVRIISYEGDNLFRLLDTDDSYRTVHRSAMKFLPDKPSKKQPKLV